MSEHIQMSQRNVQAIVDTMNRQTAQLTEMSSKVVELTRDLTGLSALVAKQRAELTELNTQVQMLKYTGGRTT